MKNKDIESRIKNILGTIGISYHQGYKSLETAYIDTEEAKAKLQQLIEKKVVEAKVETIQELLTKAVIHGGGWGKPAKSMSVNKIKNHLDHLKSTKEDK